MPEGRLATAAYAAAAVFVVAVIVLTAREVPRLIQQSRSNSASSPSPAATPSGGSTTPSPGTSPTASGSAAPPGLVITHNENVFVGSPCGGSATLHLRLEFKGAAAGDQVLVKMSGPGLPAQVTIPLTPDGIADQSFPVPGSGVYASDVVSVGGKTPLGETHAESSAQC